MNFKIFLAVALIVVNVPSAKAAEEPTTIVLGIGNKSCGSWTQARHSPGSLVDVYQGWVAGFISSSNEFANNTQHIDILQHAPDAQGIWAWVDNYCTAHPLNSVAEASDSLAAELILRAWKAKNGINPKPD
jgi:hypothetical protein